MLKELILKNRSYRRFYQDRHIDCEILRELIDLGRLAPSGQNRQGLKYVLCNNEDLNNQINSCLTWAGYIKGWQSPPEGEKPAAFIIVIKDTSLGFILPADVGFAAQNILLGAAEKGLGGCFLMAINKQRLGGILNLDDIYEIEAVIAIGYPKETVILEEVDPDGDIKYWRDDKQVHHVPKRSLEDIIIKTP